MAKTVMLQGTSSSVGKSLLVAALCRTFARKGIRVAPFKAQNMSNNAAVCADGSEIGRAQALQAQAAGVEASSDMNPVLLKPEADSRSQVIVNGRPWATLAARKYYQCRQELWSHVTAALDRLRRQFDLVIIEGAGSPAELNLHHVEIVNMSVAQYVQSPVILIGDIERGGVFAQLLGTLWLLPEAEQSLVRALIVNKFRGDRSLFVEGARILAERSQRPVLGVVPWISDLRLPEEDAADLSMTTKSQLSQDQLDVVVIRLPRIANFDDFEPLAAESTVSLRYGSDVNELGAPDAVILPGSKSTMMDLSWLRERGLASRICTLAAEGVPVVGICGGYQMLGRRLRDPQGVESDTREMDGLALLPTETVFGSDKATYQVLAETEPTMPWLQVPVRKLQGYEIHVAETTGGQSWLRLVSRNGTTVDKPDGATSADGRVWGCYLHGLFANDAFRNDWIRFLRAQRCLPNGVAPSVKAKELVEQSLDRLADEVQHALDFEQLERIIWGSAMPTSIW